MLGELLLWLAVIWVVNRLPTISKGRLRRRRSGRHKYLK